MSRIARVVSFFALAIIVTAAACDHNVKSKVAPTTTPATKPRFKFFVVLTDDGYAESSPNVDGYRLHDIQAQSDAYHSWVTLIYELDDQPERGK